MVRERVDVLGRLRKQAETADIDFLREVGNRLEAKCLSEHVVGVDYGWKRVESLIRVAPRQIEALSIDGDGEEGEVLGRMLFEEVLPDRQLVSTRSP